MSYMGHREDPEVERARALWRQGSSKVSNAFTCWFIGGCVGLVGGLMYVAAKNDESVDGTPPLVTWMLIGAGVLIVAGIVQWSGSKRLTNEALYIAKKHNIDLLRP